MLDVKITFLSLLVDIIEVEELNLPMTDDSTISNLLDQLNKKFGPKFEEMIFNSSKNLSQYVIITLNGKDIRLLGGLNTKLRVNDEVSFIPAIAGG